MAITLSATGSNKGTTQTVNVTNLTTLTGDTILVAEIAVHDSNHVNLPITSVTWNGTNLTFGKAAAVVGDSYSEIWYLYSPTVGNFTLAVTSTGAVWKGIIASSWAGTQSTGSPDATGTANNTTNASSTSITTVATNTVVIDALCSEPVVNSYGTSQTAVATALQGQSFENAAASYKILSSSGATTMTEALSFGATWSQTAVSFAQASAATPNSGFLTLM